MKLDEPTNIENIASLAQKIIHRGEIYRQKINTLSHNVLIEMIINEDRLDNEAKIITIDIINKVFIKLLTAELES